MNILFYYPSSSSAVSLSSLMIAFQKQGHQVFLLTHAEKGALHEAVEMHGVKTFAHVIKKNSSLLFYWKHLQHLKKIVRENNIDLVYSHLQQANLIAAFAEGKTRAKIILCRHHSDSAFVEKSMNAQRFDRIINKKGKTFIVPSKKVFDQMTIVEKVDPKKIHLIRYAYNFNDYATPNEEEVQQIKERFSSKLLLVSVARLIPEKRHLILLEVVNELVAEGSDIKLLVLSEGYLREELESFVKKNKLEQNIFFLGHRTNVIDHLSASDLVVHISASEASNNLVKEAALVSKPVIACHQVGDFDEYLVDGKNSILLSKENTRSELANALRKIYADPNSIDGLGARLKDTVLDLFSLEKVIEQYDPLNKKD